MLCWRVGIDPAITAGPFVTVLNDIFCTAIYLTISTLIVVQAM
jgi:Mg/Co/Ni transporter MgtE